MFARRNSTLVRLTMAAGLFCASGYVFGFRCSGRIIGPGMVPLQVESYCGTPLWTDEYTSLEIVGAGGPIEEQHEVNWEVWYFNFGSRMFMQRVLFRDGQLKSIESLNYGVDESDELGLCVTGASAVGLTTGELVARCGQPTSRRTIEGALVRRLPGYLLSTEHRREEWIYDFGAQFLKRYLITNSRVAAEEQLAR